MPQHQGESKGKIKNSHEANMPKQPTSRALRLSGAPLTNGMLATC